MQAAALLILALALCAAATPWLEADLPDDVVRDGCIAYEACTPWENFRTAACGKALDNYDISFESAYYGMVDEDNRPLTYGLLQATTAAALHRRGTCARMVHIGYKPLSVPDNMAPDAIWAEATDNPLSCVVNATYAPICETYEMLLYDRVNPASKLQELYRNCIPKPLRILDKETVHDMIEIAHCNDDFQSSVDYAFLRRDDIGTRSMLLNLYVDLLNKKDKK